MNVPISNNNVLSGHRQEGCTPHPLFMPDSLMPSYSDTQKPMMKNICFPTFLNLSKVMEL